MSSLRAIIGLLQELIRWRCIALEMQTRTLVLDKVKELERENEKFKETLDDMRRRGKHADADRLLHNRAQYACFSRGILDLAKRADVYSDPGLHLGGSEGSSGEGPVHTEPPQSDRAEQH